MRTIVVLPVAVLVGLTAMEALPAAARQDATAIAVLTARIQGKQPDNVRAIIVAQLGPPDREVGSGVRIEQWDVDGGVLTFHPMTGPMFEKEGSRTRLIRTTNPASGCLFGEYQMMTLSNSSRAGVQYWLGEVSISANARYRYVDSGQNLSYRADQADNFFMLHPKGSVRIDYAPGVTPKTRLEELPDGAAVAEVAFTDARGDAKKRYRIVAYRTSMHLVFESDEPLSFVMNKGWKNYWR